MDKEIEKLDAEILEINKKIHELDKKRSELIRKEQEKIVPIFKWTVTKVSIRKNDTFDFIYDETILRYRITKECINKDEMLSNNIYKWEWSYGGMDYLFNTVTGMLIAGVGGGTCVLVGDPKKRHPWISVSMFLVHHPDGGDITHLFQGD